MGTFRVSIEVGDPAGQRYETVEALVDTGATYATLPAPLLHALGVVPHARETFVLADGRRVERDIGRTWIRVDGRTESPSSSLVNQGLSRFSERTRLKDCGSPAHPGGGASPTFTGW